MHWSERRRRYRALLDGDACIHPGSVFDPISARIAEDLGFEVGMFAGSTASLTVLGAPDLIVLTLSEFAAQALRINRAGNLPLMVDADHGYGNALNVKRTVEELETAGVAALTIEDTLLPRGYGPSDKAELIGIEAGVGKLKAALAGRQDPSLVIAGRTSAVAIAGLDEAVRRARAYAATGVDALFLVGVQSRAQLEAIRAEVALPLLLGGGGGGLGDRAYLARQGVRIALQGHQPITAGYRAVYETLKALREGTPPSELEGVPEPAFMARLTRSADYAGWTRDFLGGDGE